MRRADLEEERRFLLDSILDLELQYNAGEITKADYESLREDYTARAADVLRAIQAYDADKPVLAAARSRREEDDWPEERTRHSGSRRAVAVLLIAGLGLLAVLSVSVLAGSSGPGDTASPSGSIAQRLAIAHQLESQGQALEALKQYDSVLRDDPANVEALTYRGWLLKLAGLIDEAQLSLDKALAADPTYADAHFFRGMLLFQDRNDPVSAIPEFETFLASNPPEDTVDAVRGVLEQARQAAAAGTSSTTAVLPPR